MNTSSGSLRHRRFIARLSPLFIGLALGGCSALPVTERFQNMEIPANDPSFRTRVYAGATMGNSHLTPDTSGGDFHLDNGDDLGTQLRLGVDVHNMLAIELETSVLGTATLQEGGADVSYSAASVNALIYGLNGVQSRSRREGWSAYGRLGMGIVKRASQVNYIDGGGSGPIIGAGAEYGFSNGLGIRGEIVRFSSDAVYAGIGAVYRFGLTPGDVGRMLADAAEPALASRRTTVASDGRRLHRSSRIDRDAELAMSDEPRREPSDEPALGAANGYKPGTVSGVARWRPVMYKDDHDRDGVRDLDDHCADTGPNVIVDPTGCGLFDEVLADVIFKSGSHYLTARARGQLDKVAERLLDFPEARVRIIAHTDATGPADENMALSARRAESVVEYMQSQYVRELQLEALGLGETRPLASNRSVEGRKRNRRVELLTVASLSDEQLADSLSMDAIVGAPRWLPPEPGTSRRSSRARGPDGMADWTPKAKSAAEPVQPSGPDAARAAVVAAKTATSGATGAHVDAVHESVAVTAPAKVVTPPLGAAVTAVATGAIDLQAERLRPLPAPAVIQGLDITGVIDGVTFDPGSSVILPSARPPLAQVATKLQQHPSARVAIMAHTDNDGSDEANQRLSERRAGTVLEHLVDLGIARPRLVSEGYGETLPLAQNVTAADRARNRRIELRLLQEAP